MHFDRQTTRTILLFGVSLLLGCILGLHPVPAKAASLPNSHAIVNLENSLAKSQQARTFDNSHSLRLDYQTTLAIPRGQEEAVYQYLKNKYEGKGDILHGQFPGLDLHGENTSDVSLFTDEYFDTPDLTLYKRKDSTRYRYRVNLTDPNDRKSGRHLVQVKLTPPGHFDSRMELKFTVRKNAVTDPGQIADKHYPLLALVKKSNLSNFKAAFRAVGIHLYDLRPVLTLRQTRRRVYVDWDNENIVSFSIDTGDTHIWWASAGFASVDIGLVENTFTQANDKKRKTMRLIRDTMVADLRRQFPALKPTTDSKYGIVLGGLIKQASVIPLLFRWKLL